jgi:SET domain-containing protein
MRTVYIDTYPHLVIVCMRDIDIGEEFLLDYGDAYNQAYLTPKPPPIPYSNDEMRDILPLMLDSDEEEEV